MRTDRRRLSASSNVNLAFRSASANVVSLRALLSFPNSFMNGVLRPMWVVPARYVPGMEIAVN
jgi:hypothetical protein